MTTIEKLEALVDSLKREGKVEIPSEDLERIISLSGKMVAILTLADDSSDTMTDLLGIAHRVFATAVKAKSNC